MGYFLAILGALIFGIFTRILGHSEEAAHIVTMVSLFGFLILHRTD